MTARCIVCDAAADSRLVQGTRGARARTSPPQLTELLEEIWPFPAGVQVLFAFLLAGPFQQRFGTVAGRGSRARKPAAQTKQNESVEQSPPCRRIWCARWPGNST
ncbi:MAG: DUF6328 family protein [Solirubrobacteraceae bacterium]